jgi:hypothetical protein
MAVDWLALQDIYGGQSYGGTGFGVQNAFAGDTIYGFNTNISTEDSAIWAAFADYADRSSSTIVDGGGTDTLDVGGYTQDQRIDLTPSTAGSTEPVTSDVGGRIGNLTIAVGTVIENAVTGAGDDAIIGNGADNLLVGNGGDDTFSGGLGRDTIEGGAGTDTLMIAADRGAVAISELAGGRWLFDLGGGTSYRTEDVEVFAFRDQTIGIGDLNVPPPPEGTLDFATLGVSGFRPGSQDFGDFTLSDDGRTLVQESQSWEQVLGDFDVTADTRLRFDFAAEVEGEIHGIMFTNGTAISEATIVQLAGSQTVGVQAYSDYVAGSGARSYDIPVGQFFTGDFDRIVFLTDDDAGRGADSRWAHMEII